jgi:hypothetical protein
MRRAWTADSWTVGMEKAWLSDACGFEKRCLGFGRLKAEVVEMRLRSVVGARCILSEGCRRWWGRWGLLRAVVNVVSGVVMMANSDGQSKRGKRVTRSETGISD